MSKSNVLEFELLKALFNGAAITNLTATGGTTQLWVSLHTADPGEAGSTANEGGYAAYTRVETARSTASTGWAATSNATTAPASVSPTSVLSFPQNTATSTGTFSYAAVWPSSNATSTGMMYYGALSVTIDFSQNVTPQLTTGGTITEQ